MRGHRHRSLPQKGRLMRPLPTDTPDISALLASRLDAIDACNADLAAKVDAIAAKLGQIDDMERMIARTAQASGITVEQYKAMMQISAAHAEALRPPPAATGEAADLRASLAVSDRCLKERTEQRDAAIARAERAEAALSASLTERDRLSEALANVEGERAQ